MPNIRFWLERLVVTICLFPMLAFASITTSKTNVQFLFVMLSKQGAINALKNKPGFYALTLKGVNPSVIYFTDQPQRYSGKVDLYKFISQWQTGAFKKLSPNAVMEAVRLVEHYDIFHKRSVSYTVVLQHPQYNAQKDMLTFQIHSLKGSGGEKLPNMAHSDYVALFIDNMAVCPGCAGQ